ncbi:MAG TPA: hypothetical protein VEC06_02015 [Paucimonas sp.]|nr:hypothetical protein [Paucimonas sp.]
MNTEVISTVELLEDGELLLQLESGGKPSYQYVYRAATGVYWDPDRKTFKFSTQKDGKYAQWFEHIVKVVRDEMNVDLQLGENTTWKHFPNEDRDAIQRAAI